MFGNPGERFVPALGRHPPGSPGDGRAGETECVWTQGGVVPAYRRTAEIHPRLSSGRPSAGLKGRSRTV